jgi:hypothetical protein
MDKRDEEFFKSGQILDEVISENYVHLLVKMHQRWYVVDRNNPYPEDSLGSVYGFRAHDVEWEAQQHWLLLKHRYGETQDLTEMKCTGCGRVGAPVADEVHPYRCPDCGHCFFS